MTKKTLAIVERYNHAYITDIWHAYKTVGETNRKAWDKIVSKQEADNGYDMRIVGAGSHFWSCAYKCLKDGKLILKYYTKGGCEEIALS